MPGESETEPSGWSPDLLRVHYDAILRDRDLRYDQRFVAQQEGIRTALLAAEKAVTKAETATERRFDSVNEFRAQLTEQAATFARVDYLAQALAARDALIGALTERVRELELARSSGAGGQAKVGDQRAMTATLVGVATLVLALVVVVVNVVTSRSG
jgi:hypothetical protein